MSWRHHERTLTTNLGVFTASAMSLLFEGGLEMTVDQNTVDQPVIKQVAYSIIFVVLLKTGISYGTSRWNTRKNALTSFISIFFSFSIPPSFKAVVMAIIKENTSTDWKRVTLAFCAFVIVMIATAIHFFVYAHKGERHVTPLSASYMDLMIINTIVTFALAFTDMVIKETWKTDKDAQAIAHWAILCIVCFGIALYAFEHASAHRRNMETSQTIFADITCALLAASYSAGAMIGSVKLIDDLISRNITEWILAAAIYLLNIVFIMNHKHRQDGESFIITLLDITFPLTIALLIMSAALSTISDNTENDLAWEMGVIWTTFIFLVIGHTVYSSMIE